MSFFHLQSLLAQQSKENLLYREFLNVPSMSAGIYTLKAGETDQQQPHTEDEIYYLIEGKAQFRLKEEDISITKGSIIFVEANMEHRFHSIEEDLIILVLFAPAEHSLKPKK